MDADTTSSLKLWVVLNRAQKSLEDPLREQVESHGLSFSEFAVLEVLLNKGALPISEVGDHVLLTSGSMTYVVDKLEEQNLLRRRRSDEDRRIIHAELTEEGRAFIKEVFSEHAALIRDLTDGLSAKETETLTTLLKRLGKSAETRDTE
jgi:MarR family 2-MHQ and catechol resistance regulon transcriptional repressor